MLSRSIGMPSRREGPPSIWDTHGISGNVSVNPDASSSAPYPQELNPWSSGTEEPLHSSTVEKSERRTQDLDQRCQSGQSAKNSVIFSGGDSASGKKKATVRKETDAVSVAKPKLVHKKTEHIAATPSEPTFSRGRSVSKKRSIRGKSNHGSFLRQPCRYYVRGTCTRTSCEYWHPPEGKKTTSQKEEKGMTRMLWLLWKVYHNWVVYHKIQMNSFLKEQNFGEARCRKCWDRFEKYGSLSPRYVKRVSGKESTIVGKKKCQSSSSAKSLRCEIWGQVPWRDWKTAAMCPKQGLESCRKDIQAQRERQGYIPLSRGGMGTPGCVNKRAGGKIVCSWFRSEYAHGQ